MSIQRLWKVPLMQTQDACALPNSLCLVSVYCWKTFPQTQNRTMTQNPPKLRDVIWRMSCTQVTKAVVFAESAHLGIEAALRYSISLHLSQVHFLGQWLPLSYILFELSPCGLSSWLVPLGFLSDSILRNNYMMLHDHEPQYEYFLLIIPDVWLLTPDWRRWFIKSTGILSSSSGPEQNWRLFPQGWKVHTHTWGPTLFPKKEHVKYGRKKGRKCLSPE